MNSLQAAPELHDWDIPLPLELELDNLPEQPAPAIDQTTDQQES